MTVQLDENNFPIELPDDLTPDERNQINAVAAAPDQTGKTLARTAAALGGAFLVYQAYMKQRLKRQLKGADDLPPKRYAEVMQETFNTFMPAWTYMVTPAIFSAYLSGVEMSEQTVANRTIQDLAMRYTWNLGEYLNGKSIDSAVRGYQALLNRNINAKLALGNTIDAFAVPLPGMRALVKMWTGKEEERPSEAILPSVKKARINRQVIAQLNQRANTIGDEESFSVQSTGRQLGWTYAQQVGLIPQNATRVWMTARDERVCPQCGPLDGMEVPVSEPFRIGKAKIWSPSLHVNCRCSVKLKSHLLSEVGGRVFRHIQSVEPQWTSADESFSKAAGQDVVKADWDAREHPRDMRSGRFSNIPVTRFKEPELADNLEQLANEALLREATVAPDKPQEKPKLNLNIFGPPEQEKDKPNLNIAALDLAIDVPKGPELSIGPTLDIAPDLALGMDLDIGPVLGGKRPNVHLKPITDIDPPDTVKHRKSRTVSYVPVSQMYAIYDQDSRSFKDWSAAYDMLEINNVHFTSDPETLHKWAEDFRREKLAQFKELRKSDLYTDVAGSITVAADYLGPDVSLILDDRDVDRAVEWYEKAINSDDYDNYPDDWSRAQIYDPDEPAPTVESRWGYKVRQESTREDVSYRRIVDALHLDQVVETMEPRVVQVDEVRDDTRIGRDPITGSQDGHINDNYKVDIPWIDKSIGGVTYRTRLLTPEPRSKQFDVED